MDKNFTNESKCEIGKNFHLYEMSLINAEETYLLE